MGQYYKPIILDSKKKKVVSWMYTHDYRNGLKLMEHSWIGNDFMMTVENNLIPGGAWYKQPLVWAGDYADPEGKSKSNLHNRCEKITQIVPKLKKIGKRYKYIVNHDKKEFVNKDVVPTTTMIGDKHPWQIHPLSLLTCEGNGRGGGDYHKESPLIGAWARDVISIESKPPVDYKELFFNLTE